MTASHPSEAHPRGRGAPPRLLLLGGGHAHVEVIRRLGLARAGNCEPLLVSPARLTPYSGMLPGFVAGDYGFDDIHVDLPALCAASDIAFRQGEATGIDAERRSVALADGSVLSYDLLSLDIGSRPSHPRGAQEGIAVKPIASFAERLPDLDRLVRSADHPVRLAVVGQGVAGVEIAFALRRRFARSPDRRPVEILLVGRSNEPMPSRGALARRLVAKELRKADIATVDGFDAVAFVDGVLVASDGRQLDVQEVIWTTSSAAPPWLRSSGLALDERGFVRVDRHLRSISHPAVFAAGDVASLYDPRPKSGVFAVRAGPVLHHNLRQALSGATLRAFRPQRHWLALISLANGSAIADKWGLAASGRWVARWKRWSDTSFVERYAIPPRASSRGGNRP
ncbi:FAD-dependent oxidoreductase [uncultured Aureimonas sp.]|uniref:FAD-dependent oxidoreductase n=1 Tax=uncultured Aureimonas sp. TaxID=1604662 RepID=UPI0025CCB1CF|nr:FAD-dependent oxidoreductase [uncultured Aureimonas sp.]